MVNMKVEDLGKIPDEGDVLVKVERLKIVLEEIARNNNGDPKEYSELRKVFIGIPALNKVMPKFLQINKTSVEFRRWIQDQSPKWAPRVQLIRDAINPIIDILEYETGEGALEFQKNYEEKGLIGNGGFWMGSLYLHRFFAMAFSRENFVHSFFVR